MDIAERTRTILDRREGPEAPLRIVQAGHPALRRTARTAEGRLAPDQLRALVDAMTTTMRDAPGVGLAAPQIGLPLQLFVIEDRYAPAEQPAEEPGEDRLERRPVALRAFLDPSVEPLGEQRVFAWEGCLSVDGWQSIVPRSRRVRFTATELLADGRLVAVEEEHKGWPARILQHETDHLAGTLCHDLMVPRSFIAARYVPHYEQMPLAVRRLGLSGEITGLTGDEVIVEGPPAAAPAP